jgi:hypothetical protein
MKDIQYHSQLLHNYRWIVDSRFILDTLIILVKMIDKSLPFCVDYGALNKIIVKDRYLFLDMDN